jgi:hypothetical protein
VLVSPSNLLRRVALSIVAVALFVGCARQEADQPSVAPAVRGTTKTPTPTTTAGPKPATTKPSEPGTTEIAPQRLPGTPIAPPPVAPGTDISSDDLAAFVPGAILSNVADTTDVEVRFTTNERDRRADIDVADQKVLVDDAKAAGWISGGDVITGTPSGRGLRASVTVELFETAAGAASYFSKEAPYWNPKPSTLTSVDLPEVPGAQTYQVQNSSSSPAITQINVSRGPVYLKVAVYDQIDFAPEATDAAIEIMRGAIAAVDAKCGASCKGLKGKLVTPVLGVASEATCVNFFPNTLDPVVLPTSALVAASCTSAHDGELIGPVGASLRAYPVSRDESTALATSVSSACITALTKRQPTAEADGNKGIIDIRAILPTAAEFDAGQKTAVCIVFSVGKQFTKKYLP